MSQPLQSGARRYLTTSATTAAFASLVARFAIPTSFVHSNGIFIPTSALTTAGQIIPVPPGFRGLRIAPFGAGSDNQTFSINVFAAAFSFPTQTPNPCTPQSVLASAAEVELMYLGKLDCTLSTGVGVSGSAIISASERVCDTVAWTVASTSSSPKGPMTDWQTAFALGTATAFSPADNTQGHMTIPDLGGAGGFLLDFDMTGATSGNATYEFLA